VSETLPSSIGVAEFELFGVTLRCHVLDNGQRVIEAEGMERLFEAMSEEPHVDVDAAMESFARWVKGR
jgi:hypothetical protein